MMLMLRVKPTAQLQLRLISETYNLTLRCWALGFTSIGICEPRSFGTRSGLRLFYALISPGIQRRALRRQDRSWDLRGQILAS